MNISKFILCLVSFGLPCSAFAQLSTSYRDGVLVCKIKGDGTNDNTWLTAAVARCNAHSGPSIIMPVGMVRVTSQHNFTSATSLIGAGPGSGFNVENASPTQTFTWNNNWGPELETPITFSADVAAGNSSINVATGTVPSKGDWLVIWDHSNIPGVTPHWDTAVNGFGHGQHPETVHLVDEVFGSSIKLADPLPFGLDVDADAAGAVIPESVLDRGIVIDNLYLDWTGGTIPDFATVFRFTACEGVVVTSNVVTSRNSPGAVWFSYCMNCECNIRSNGSAKTDNVYGIVVDVVNGVILDPIMKGTRHAFTTTAGQNSSTTGIAVGSVNDTTERITVNSHGFNDGWHFSVVGTVSDLANNTPYWVVNSTVNDFQVAASPGGAPINLTGTTSTGTLRRSERWGTPLNVVCRGIWYQMPKWSSSSTTITRQTWDTHAEGYKILVEGALFVMNNDQTGVGSRTTQYVAQSRSYGTIFKNCKFISDENFSGIAVRLLAEECQVVDCDFDGRFWQAVQVTTVNGGVDPGTRDVDPDNCVIARNHFDNCYAWTINQAYGDNLEVTGNSFFNCGYSQGNSPFNSKSFIRIWRGTGHRVYGNHLQQHTGAGGGNTFAMDLNGAFSTTDVKVTGNNLTGYGSGDPGFGRKWALTAGSWDDPNNEIDISPSHGWVEDDEVEFAAGSTLPGPLVASTKYYVIEVDTDSISLSTTPAGGAINFGAGGGTATIQNDSVSDFEATYDGLNIVDE